MGADIHSFAEAKRDNRWVRIESPLFVEGKEPFGWRSYAMFGFLADVRNYSHSPVICEPKGLPEDSDYLNEPSPYAYDTNPMNGEPIPESERETRRKMYWEDCNYHSHSWLTLKELLDVDYEQTFEDRRVGRWETPNFYNGAYEAPEGEGNPTTLREHLGEQFFQDLAALQSLGLPEEVRVVFWFDN